MGLPASLSWFFASFRFRLFAIFTAVTALATTFFVSLYVISEIRSQRNQAAANLQMLAVNLAERIPLPLFAENRGALLQLAQDTAALSGLYSVTITTRNAKTLVTLRQPILVPQADLLSATVPVISHPMVTSPEEALTGKQDASGIKIGTVHLETDTLKLKENSRRLIMTAALISFAYWIVVSVLCYLALRKVTSSFNALMQGLRIMRTGDFEAKIEVESDDEPGRAACAVNELGASLLEREAENRRLNEELVRAMRLEVQEEKKQLMAKLIETNRMTSLGLLASSMAHEINNPNASIRLAGQYLTRAWRDALPLLVKAAEDEGDFVLGGLPFSIARNNIQECGATIDRNTERIAQVVQDLRSYSLGERNLLHPGVNINQVVKAALTIVRSHSKRTDITIVADMNDDVPMITGSLHQLEQVVVNLLMNALQAMPAGKGMIAARTSYNQVSNEVMIEVCDEGEGIPPETRERLLEPFFSTRIDKGGSGLGLFVANFIVTAHNGRLKFDSVPGNGTTVTIHLPTTQPSKTA